MLDLGKIRDEIDATDDEIVRLFQHRMALTAEVAQYKIETGKAVFDAERERQKLEKLTGEGTNAFKFDIEQAVLNGSGTFTLWKDGKVVGFDKTATSENGVSSFDPIFTNDGTEHTFDKVT